MFDWVQWRAASVAFVITAAVFPPAQAASSFTATLQGRLGFDVQAGIDKSTQRFLRSYPKVLRQEVVLAANQVLDRADQSVSRIFLQSEDLLRQVDVLSICTAKRLEHVPTGWWHRLTGHTPNYTALIQDARETLAGKSSLSSAPTELKKGYVDVDNVIFASYCLSHQQGLDQLGVLEARPPVVTSYILWQRMEEYCLTVGDCYALVAAKVDSALSEARQQDKVVIKAEQRLQAITRPPEVRTTEFSADFGLTDYERALNGLLSISDDLSRAEARRVEKAKAAYATLIAQMDRVGRAVSAAEHKSGKIERCNLGYGLKDDVEGLHAPINSLAAFEVLSGDDLKPLETRLANYRERQRHLAAISGRGVLNDGRGCKSHPPIIIRPLPGSREPV